MIFEFDRFQLDRGQLELRDGDTPVAIEPKSFDLLLLLVEHRDRVLTKDEIFDQVWTDVFVSDATLSSAIAQIRRVLNDSGQAQKFVRTVRGRGFRFVANVSEVKSSSSATQDTPTEGAAAPNLGPPVIAVLPFDLLSTDDTHAALADALPSELIATLSQLKWVKVIARASAFQFRGPLIQFDEIRYKLGASYVLTGSVELLGRRLTIFTELVDARSGQVVWTESFNGAIEDIFEMRARIAQEVAAVCEYRLALNETERLNRVPSENLDAWGHYHRGIRAMFHYNKSDNEMAGHHFARAAEIDPNFARAEAALSYTEFQKYFQQFGKEFEDHKRLAMEHAERAVHLDPVDPYCNLMLGRAKWIHGETAGGLISVDRSLSLAPNYSFAFYNSALLNSILCDGQRAEVHVASALARSPIDPHIQTMLGTRALAAFIRDDLDQAVSCADQVLASTNAHVHVYLIAAGIHGVAGNPHQAERGLSEVRRRNVDLSSSGFLKHFDLHNAEKKQALFGALEQLGA